MIAIGEIEFELNSPVEIALRKQSIQPPFFTLLSVREMPGCRAGHFQIFYFRRASELHNKGIHPWSAVQWQENPGRKRARDFL